MAKDFYKNAAGSEGGGAAKDKPKFDIPGPKKAAIVLVALGAETSSEIFKHLNDVEVEQLTTQIARLEGVTPEMREAVLEEFHNMAMAQQFIAQGGLSYAEEILEGALGSRKAKEILEKVHNSIRTTGFNMLDNVDPNQLTTFIQKEHPQTVALLLSRMSADKAAGIINVLPQEMQVEVATRIATMESISPDVLTQVEQVLAVQMKSMFRGETAEVGGVQSVAEMLNLVDRGAEKNILGNLERDNPELATEIKNLMFVFEDITLIDDKGMQRTMKEVDTKELSLALKGASEQVQTKFFNNMSSRAAEGVREDMEYMGPVRLKDVEEAQQKIVDVIRRLEEDGEIIISGRGGSEEIVV
ncbi:MAG: flagellar motor switch protein FliG [Fibrobacterales bacterium]